MQRLAIPAVAALLAAAPGATHAQTWRPIARACAAQIGEQGGHWPEWSACTIARAFPGADPARVQQCIQQVAEQRARDQVCNNCGDAVGAVVSCATEP